MNPFAEALSQLSRRTPQAADLSSSQWADVPLALRERAFFSARVTNAQYLQNIKDRVESILNPRTVQRDGRPVTEGLNLASARAELKLVLQSIGYNPGEKAGGLEDLSSDARLNLQLKQNVESAQGFGNFLQGQAEGALDAFPAQELFRAEDREEPRNWPTRWMRCSRHCQKQSAQPLQRSRMPGTRRRVTAMKAGRWRSLPVRRCLNKCSTMRCGRGSMS